MHLLGRGYRVRIAARHPERNARLLQSDRATACRADLFQPDSLKAAVRGADAAVNATSLYLEQGNLTFDAVHVEAAARLAGLAAEAGLRGTVQLSGIGADAAAQDSYIRARGRGEIAVKKVNSAATIVRSSVMFGEEDALLSAIRDVARRSPFYPLFGAGDTRLQPAWVEDVAEAIVRILEIDEPAATYELGGADIVTYRQLVNCVVKARSLHTRPIPVPFAVWRALAAIAEHLPGAPLSRAQVTLMRADNVASHGLPGMASVGITPRGVIEHIRGQGFRQ
jgi:uncharacterized protein YbjT (DUF2867 family)